MRLGTVCYALSWIAIIYVIVEVDRVRSLLSLLLALLLGAVALVAILDWGADGQDL